MSVHVSEERATVDVATAAAILGISKLTLYSAIRAGNSPVRTIKIGRRIVVPKAALDAILRGNDAKASS